MMPFRSITDFLDVWKEQRSATLAVFHALTNESLGQQVSHEGRTLGRISWHLVECIGDQIRRCGLDPDAPEHAAPQPATAAAITAWYERASASVVEIVQTNWTDAMLADVLPLYGQNWTRSHSLFVLMVHLTHHRGQMTVLMRQAGLRVPGVCGPAKEDWAQWNMAAPV